MLGQRIITASVLLAIAGICLSFGGILLQILVLVIYAAGAYEFFCLPKTADHKTALASTGLLLLLPLSYWFAGLAGLGLIVPILALAIFARVVISTERQSHLGFPIDELGHHFLALGYIGLFGTLLFASAGFFSRALLLSFLLTVVAADTGAYFGGRAIGGIKLSPRISPGKTVSGAICGIVLSVVVSLLLRQWLGLAPDWNSRSVLTSVGAGILISVLSILGDLSESLLKRVYEVKDSGSLLPGHGGVLDRIDGLLFAVPALFVLGGLPV